MSPTPDSDSVTDGSGAANGIRFAVAEAAHLGDERTMLLGVLQRQRDLVAWKLRDASDAALRSVATPSGLTLHGLVRHLTNVERSWVRDDFAGESGLVFDRSDGNPDGDWRVSSDATIAALLAGYAAESRLCDTVVAGIPSLDVVSSRNGFSLRWILLHLVEETARHLGHIDLLRELADGVTGEEPQG
ncbi:DinB family protein [Microbacteriaceae bacterium VKM Ac-2855]|nr:DinB family protein [Microbacteriaceae bacterium VKM Ac-2855]